MKLLLKVLILNLTLLVVEIAYALPPLADDAAGMTCRHYMVGAYLTWMRQGGDWIDVNDKEYGDASFATEKITHRPERQWIFWDITNLAKTWNSDREPKGAVLLRILPSQKNEIAIFHSRESPESSARPSLAIEWSDGSRSRFSPFADTHLNCSTYSSRGTDATLKVSSDQNVILIFPFKNAEDKQVRSASLMLATDNKQYGNTATIGIFLPLPPWAKVSKPNFGVANRYPKDRGIENNSEVLFATKFESIMWRFEWSSLSGSSNVQIVGKGEGNGFIPLDGDALKVTIAAGQNQGLDLRYNFSKQIGTEPEQIYFRYYLRFGENWDPTKDGGKLPGLAGTYDRAGWGMRKSDGTNGWSLRGGFFRRPENALSMENLIAIGSYAYTADMQDSSGDVWGWNLGPSGLLKKNHWYSVEQYVQMNQPGSSDGIFRAWIDGYLVFEKTDIKLRDIPSLRIESAWMNVYHGGVSPAPQDMSLYIDNVVVSRNYIGPLTQPF